VVSIVEAAAYCSKSLSRIGLDVLGLLRPVVSTAVKCLFQRHVQQAVTLFLSSTEAHKWVAMPVSQRPRASSGEESGEVFDVLTEAYSLMSHPPLAVLVNGVCCYIALHW
jgi:hypothetical protein